MDLVNSVTQNSNNRNVTMENRGQGDQNDGNDDESRRNFSQRDNEAQNNHQNDPTDMASTTTTATINIEASRNQVPDYLKAIGMDPRKFWPKKYRFTREKPPGQHNPLSIAQRNFYETNGFIVIDECAQKKLLESIKSQHKQSAYVSEFLVDKLIAKNNKLLQYVKCFCDETVMLMTHQLIETFQTNRNAKAIIDNKQTHRQQLFRDWIFLPFRPIDKVVCAVTAIEPIDNVILVVPGTHRVGQCTISSTLENISAAYESSQERQSPQLREIYESSPEKLSELVEKSKKGFKYVNLKPGQTLFYHPGLVHGFSDDLVNFRKSQLALISYYAAADCEYIDLRKSLELMSDTTLPVSLAHFNGKNPSDYSSWMDKPKLLKDTKASL